MPQRILNEDWSDYDNRKLKGVDARYFSCEEEWERNYLVRKIRKFYRSIQKLLFKWLSLLVVRKCLLQDPASSLWSA
jgi:hypothetical protein